MMARMSMQEIRDAFDRSSRAAEELNEHRRKHGDALRAILRKALPAWWDGSDSYAAQYKQSNEATIQSLFNLMTLDAEAVRDALKPFDGREPQ